MGLQKFFDDRSEGFYVQSGTPYRRGYMFYGPPGTGKSSLSRAIASHYDLELFILADMNDTSPQDRFHSLPHDALSCSKILTQQA